MSERRTFITNPDIDQYLLSLFPSQDPVLREMEELGAERGFPIVGPLVGRLLHLLAVISGAKRVFELGSGFGYSAYWFARAVGEGGSVCLTERSESNALLAEDFLSKGGLAERVSIRCGESLGLLEESEGGYDIIFNDIDKEHYPAVTDRAYEKLRPGGLFITDNVLWFGRVLTDDESPSTAGVKKFTEGLLSHRGFITTVIPVRDGVSVSVKI